MTTPAPTPRQRAAARALDSVYRHFGLPAQLVLIAASGLVTVPVIAKLRVSEAEESVDGAKIEAQVKGYACQIRTADLADVTVPYLRGRLELLAGHSFDGFDAFAIGGEPRSLGRDGLQKLFKLSAAPDIAVEDQA